MKKQTLIICGIVIIIFLILASVLIVKHNKELNNNKADYTIQLKEEDIVKIQYIAYIDTPKPEVHYITDKKTIKNLISPVNGLEFKRESRPYYGDSPDVTFIGKDGKKELAIYTRGSDLIVVSGDTQQEYRVKSDQLVKLLRAQIAVKRQLMNAIR